MPSNSGTLEVVRILQAEARAAAVPMLYLLFAQANTTGTSQSLTMLVRRTEPGESPYKAKQVFGLPSYYMAKAIPALTGNRGADNSVSSAKALAEHVHRTALPVGNIIPSLRPRSSAVTALTVGQLWPQNRHGHQGWTLRGSSGVSSTLRVPLDNISLELSEMGDGIEVPLKGDRQTTAGTQWKTNPGIHQFPDPTRTREACNLLVQQSRTLNRKSEQAPPLLHIPHARTLFPAIAGRP
jgi:hypothetical protein